MIGFAEAMKMAGVVEMGTGFVRRKAGPDQEERVLPRSTPFDVSGPPSAPTRTFFFHRALRRAASSQRRSK